MTRKISSIIALCLLAAALGCARNPHANLQASGDTKDVSPEDLYLLYPQLLLLQQKLDEANAYYYLGDVKSSLDMANSLIERIVEMKSTSPEPFVCEHLDLMEDLAACLRDRINMEEIRNDWRTHMQSVIDSIAANHVVEEELEIVFNWRTDHWIKYFQGKGRKHFTRWLERVEIYREIIEPILVKCNVPRDLLWLSVIESGLNLNARSNVKATGPWQFMAGTARLFNLRINWWIDERKDIIASTYAAAHYLSHLHSLFGNWELTLAAYNAGEYRVADAISRQRTNDYWKLRLPSQTRWFVPKYMAALAIGRDPSRYGFGIPSAEPLRFDVVTVDKSTDLRLIAKSADCTLTTLTNLNPALKRWATPPGMEIELKVPLGTGERVTEAMSSIPPEDRVSWVKHSIKKGETLSQIAAKYEISQSELKRINEIKDPKKIRSGQVLLIPTRDNGASSAISSAPYYKEPPSLPSRIELKKYTPPADRKKVVYTVKDRDTLSEIAENFKVSLSKLRSWNDLRFDSLIRPGDNLVIYLSPGSEPHDSAEDDAGDQAGTDGKKKVVHIVRKGETLSHICRRYNTTLAEVLAWNSGVKKDRLHPGDKITIWLDHP